MFTPNFSWASDQSLKIIEKYLNTTLIDPVQEFLARPKKEIRAQLVLLGFNWSGAKKPVSPALNAMMIILESLHAGSLIVDDIQDASPERRGRPSFHNLHGIPTAINSGNWLYFWAIQKIKELPIPDRARNSIVSATLDMLFEGHIGQALDVGTEITRVPRKDIPDLCYSVMNSKTGALTGLAVYCGAIIGGLSEAKAKAASIAGREFGMLLQIFDDIKNLKISTTAIKDKRHFEDLKNLRPGFIWAFTAKKLGPKALNELKKVIKTLPDVKHFITWCGRHDFFSKVTTSLHNRKKEFLIKYPHSAETLNDLIKKLEAAYENT